VSFSVRQPQGTPSPVPPVRVAWVGYHRECSKFPMSVWWKKWSISLRGSGRMKSTPRPSRHLTRCCRRPPTCDVRGVRMTPRPWLLSLSIVALLCIPLAGWGASIVITVPQEAQVQGPQITLGDVADIQGEPADTV